MTFLGQTRAALERGVCDTRVLRPVAKAKETTDVLMQGCC